MNQDAITTRELLPPEFEYFAANNDEPIHLWFELSYAHYLTIPRSVLQSMPTDWQKRFVQCLEELDELMDWRPKQGRYNVQLRNGNLYTKDPLMDYERGRRIVPLKLPTKNS